MTSSTIARARRSRTASSSSARICSSRSRSSAPTIGRISRPGRSCSTGVEIERIAVCWHAMTCSLADTNACANAAIASSSQRSQRLDVLEQVLRRRRAREHAREQVVAEQVHELDPRGERDLRVGVARRLLARCCPSRAPSRRRASPRAGGRGCAPAPPDPGRVADERPELRMGREPLAQDHLDVLVGVLVDLPDLGQRDPHVVAIGRSRAHAATGPGSGRRRARRS